MLHIFYKTKPAKGTYISSVDVIFNQLCVGDIIDILQQLLNWGQATQLTDISKIGLDKPVKVIQIETKFGITDLTHLCTSVKCLGLVMRAIQQNKFFVFNAALLGGNYLDILIQLTENTDKIGVVCEYGEFYEIEYKKRVKVLVDGKETLLWI